MKAKNLMLRKQYLVFNYTGIKDILNPNDLILDLETTIGNCDKQFF